MASENSTQDFVYRLATQKEWAVAQKDGYVPLREIDKKDGYIHLSTREQLLETAGKHFVGATKMLVLEISIKSISENLKFEMAVKRGALFPHLYSRLSVQDVVRVIMLLPDGDEFMWGSTL